MMTFWGLLNLSSHMAHKGPRRNRYQQPTGMVKKACPREGGGSALSPAQTQGRQDALFHGQGRSQVDARSVLPVRELGKLARTPLAAFFNIPLKEKRLSGPIKPHNLISSVKYYTMNQIIYALMLHGLLKFF
ncbi:MAG: hypothetical protein VST68_02465 [Nitrospirota bacterium]|nr:hypothetical protein [Nitrospirota bacterium]